MKKLLAIVVLGLLLSGNAYAKCIEGDCKNGQGTFIYDSGNKYVGEFQDGLRHGQGTFTWATTKSTHPNKYVGEFKNNEANGEGTITFNNGSISKGTFLNGLRHGYQNYLSGKTGNSYDGYYKKGKRHGEGIVTEKDGSIYEVYYKKGKLKKSRETEKSKEKKTTKTEQVKIEKMISDSKNTCKDLGFSEGTEKFADCSLKLYTQKVELAGKNKQQIVMQPQSSGSNTMTIYDPSRDANRAIDQGMRMLSGRCTLGIDC